MSKAKVDNEFVPVESAAGAAPRNAADAIIEIARDSLHAHLNTVGRVSDVLIPTSLGTVLRHDVSALSRKPNWSFLGVCPACGCGWWNAIRQNLQGSNRPVGVKEGGDAYTVEFEAPGWDKSDLNVLLGPRSLTVEGKKTDTKATVQWTWRSPEDISPEGASATLDMGVLRVVVYKKEENRARRVEVNPA
jgi:hypothetical protein